MSQKSIVTIMEPLEKALACAGDYEEEWKRAMIAMFKALALNACNGHHLERLHAALPENYRLIREDLLLLKKIVAQLRPKGAKADHAPPDDAILDMLASIRGEALMREYYEFVLAHRSFGDRVIGLDLEIDAKTGNIDIKPKPKPAVTPLYPRNADGSVSSVQDHETLWEGEQALLEFTYVEESATIEVEIIFLETNLTEPFVHAVRTTFAKNAACSVVTQGQSWLKMQYVLDDKGLMQLIETVEEKERLKRRRCSVTTKTFLAAIRERFTAEGIAFGEIQPRKHTKGILERLHEFACPSLYDVEGRKKPRRPSKKAPRRRKSAVAKDAREKVEPPPIIVE